MTTTPDPAAPALPSDAELVDRFRRLVADLGRVEAMRIELAGIDARLHERGINPNTYTPGDGDSLTIDHEEPA
jgi:hypothetical protein